MIKRQVPHYLIIGKGRVARHFQHYFSLLHLSFSTWHRNESLETLYVKIKSSSHVLLLISDHAIEEFINQHLKNSSSLCLHFSGSHLSDYAYGAHPLMTFNANLYSLEQYQTIPFVVEENTLTFSELLPGLPNSHVYIKKSLKEKYHALCVLSGNFSCILWQKLFSSFEKEFNLSPSVAYPYLQQQMNNLMTNPDNALTGPLVRRDTNTIEKNLLALKNDPFQEVYQSFVSCFQQLHKNK